VGSALVDALGSSGVDGARRFLGVLREAVDTVAAVR
jgi:hypothetical protein